MFTDANLIPSNVIDQTGLGQILNLLSGGNSGPTKLTTGQYIIGHWNFDSLIHPKLEYNCLYPDLDEFNFPGNCSKCTAYENNNNWFHADTCKFKEMSCYGVCDSIEQFNEMWFESLNTSRRHFCVSFTPVVKKEQPPEGGWRWHKWGPYVGNGKPKHEYLHDETDFEKVFCFHIYELAWLSRAQR